jgi:hypothetical protein
MLPGEGRAAGEKQGWGGDSLPQQKTTASQGWKDKGGIEQSQELGDQKRTEDAR